MISVCIATHNGEKYIKEQLDSILIQLDKEDEIVISDDGSNDSTLDIIQSYRDERIKVFRYRQSKKSKQTNNVYAARNFQNAIINSKGDYIFLADQDDIWYPNKVSQCIEILKDYDLVQHNLIEVDAKMKELGLHYKTGFKYGNFLIKGGSYHGCAMAFKRCVLEYVIPFPPRLALHDYWIGFLTELKGKVFFLDQPLMLYRLHGNNISQYNNNSFFYKITHRVYIVYHLILRILLTIK